MRVFFFARGAEGGPNVVAPSEQAVEYIPGIAPPDVEIQATTHEFLMASIDEGVELSDRRAKAVRPIIHRSRVSS